MIKLLFAFACLIYVTTATTASSEQNRTEYYDTALKDFEADAPWRVKGITTPIPIGFFIKDADQDDLEHLDELEIVVFNKDGLEERIYFRQYGGVRITARLFAEIITKFLNPVSPYKDQEPITAENLGFRIGDTIDFEARIRGRDSLGESDVNYAKRLRVNIEDPLPRPDEDWLYGDAHYHTQYTDNPAEWGGQLNFVKQSIKALGLDWLTTTDHASDNGWDLDATKWNSYKQWVNTFGNDSGSDLPFIAGEEISCEPEDGNAQNMIHLLVYNNAEFISGEVDSYNNAQRSLSEVLNDLYETGLAFAAHPSDFVDFQWPLASLEAWNVGNYETAVSHQNFYGLESWNTRTTARYVTDGENINPFNAWDIFPETDENHFLYDLNRGIADWRRLLIQNLNPIRKIVITGGSDAHGDMNYSCSRTLLDYECNDNAAGKVRTLVYAPGHNGNSVLSRLKKGNSIVTDGPVILIGLDTNGDNTLRKKDGDSIVGDIASKTEGENIAVLVTWIPYNNRKVEKITLFFGESTGESVYPLDISNAQENRIVFQLNNLPKGHYYLRAECESEIFVDRTTGMVDRYRAYTNPLWINVKKNVYSLSVSKTGRGTGSISSFPVGIDCGADCTEEYATGTVVTLTATPDPNSSFAAWEEGCTGTSPTCQVTMNRSKNVTARFVSPALTVTKMGKGTGTVSSSPVGIDCGTDCREKYARGTVVTLKAAPDPDSSFAGWTGACMGTSLTCQVTMNQSKTVTAKFVIPGVLSVTPLDDLDSSGNVGGPFSPSNIVYLLKNTGGRSITFSVSKTQRWVSLSKKTGDLSPGAIDKVIVSINSNANNLVFGSYNETISFTNLTNANGNTTRNVNLTINAPLSTYPDTGITSAPTGIIPTDSGAFTRTGKTMLHP